LNTIFARMQAFADVLATDGASVDPARRAHMQMVQAIVVDNTFGGSLDRDHAIEVFNAHNDEVRHTVSPERLLVYEPGEGWDRLCAFLRVPVPEAPSPKVNTTADFSNQFPGRA
jgi:hypothetical protein